VQSSSSGGPFAVLNGSLAGDALVVWVPPHVEVAAPLYVLHAYSSAVQAGAAAADGGERTLAAAAPRLLVVLGEGATLELVEEHVSMAAGGGAGQGAGAHAAVPVAEVTLGAGACLKHGYVQREAAGSCHFKATLVQQVRVI
jgi:Fe-S cluster assembly protein SufD